MSFDVKYKALPRNSSPQQGPNTPLINKTQNTGTQYGMNSDSASNGRLAGFGSGGYNHNNEAPISHPVIKSGNSKNVLLSALPPLHKAAVEGDSDLVKDIIPTFGVDINARDQNGKTALYLAAANGKLNATVALIENGADPFSLVVLDDGTTPPHSDLVEVAEAKWNWHFMCSAQVVIAREKYPLHHAIYKGDTKEFIKLINKKPELLDQKMGKDDITPLQWASRNGKTEFINLILAYKEEHALK